MQYLLIATHLNSGSTTLCRILNTNPKISGFTTDIMYDSPLSLMGLGKKIRHNYEMSRTARICMDELVFNHTFSCKDLYRLCKFIYLMRKPKPTIDGIVKERNYSFNGALRYYCFRLRRLYEMSRNTPEAIFLTHDDIITKRCFHTLEEYLELDVPLSEKYQKLSFDPADDPGVISGKLDEETSEDKYMSANVSYQKYSNIMKKFLKISSCLVV